MRLARISNYQSPEIVTTNVQEYEPLSYCVNVFTDKDKVKFVKNVENLCRTSSAYKEYIKYLKDNIEMNKCSFFNNITNVNRRFKIDIHHEPFTLYDITLAVTEKWISEARPLNYFLIAEEVMKLHYQNRVGLIPLSRTAHEVFHDGQLFIPLQSVYGNFLKFLEEYEPYIDLDTKAILHSKIKLSKEQLVHDFTVLNKRYVYLQTPYGDLKPLEL